MIVALVGNQNSGKTTLFNALTGSNQKIGNWPGVTVERREGKLIGYEDIKIVDLPGLYSLSPYTSEEEISKNFLLNNKPDAILNVVDATNIERGLYLTTQLLELGIEVILALNMIDLLKKRGTQIDLEKLSSRLKIKVVAVSAKTKTGLNELKEVLKQNKSNGSIQTPKIYSECFEKEICKLEEKVKKGIEQKISRFNVMKMLEGDPETESRFNLGGGLKQEIKQIVKQIEKVNNLDIEQVIVNERYAFIESIKGTCLIKKKESKKEAGDLMDRLFLNRWLAIPIFMLIMVAIYYLSVGPIGNIASQLFSNVFLRLTNKTKCLLEKLGASGWVVSLVIDGVFKGVGAVLNFIPQLIILLTCISILEASGYMARISFIFDKLFRFLGLSGKSLIPFIIGSSCSVPAITSCRTIKSNREKEMVIMLTPFVPCSAKLPMIVLFCGYFFPKKYWFMEISIYFLAILLIVLVALILKKFVYREENAEFIFELPEYKLPSIKYIIKDVFDKTWDFICRAGTIILLCSCAVWFLLSFSWKMQYGVKVSQSMLATIGRAFSWFFFPILGEFNWGASVSAIQGLIAKEQVVSSLSIISGFSEGAGVFSSEMFSCFSPASAYGFLVFNLFSAPCVGALGAMKSELNSTKKMLLMAFAQIFIAWVLAIVCTTIGNLIIIFKGV